MIKESELTVRQNRQNQNLKPKKDRSIKESELKTDRYINISRLYRSIQSEDRYRKIDQRDLSPITADM
jgi:hypothetical protein